MLQSKLYRAAAMVLSLVMVLGLMACGGNGSGNQPQSGSQAGGSVEYSDLFGSWASEDMVLSFLEDFPGVAFMAYVEHPDEVFVYGFTIEGNAVYMELEPDQYNEYVTNPPAQMELTMKSGLLVYGDAVFYTASFDIDGPQALPAASEPAVGQTVPVQTQPMEAAPAVSTNLSDWYGVWDSGSWLLVINSDHALAYNIDDAEDEFEQSVCISDIWDCSYVMDGDTMKMDFYDMAGNLMETGILTLEGGFLCSNGDPVFLKHTNNTGMTDHMEGAWYALPDAYFEFESGWDNASGDIISFYGDGTCLIQWSEASPDTHDGYYQMTTKFDNPAIRMVLDGIERGTYEYEFLSNDLLMIYTDNERCYGYLLYRR